MGFFSRPSCPEYGSSPTYWTTVGLFFRPSCAKYGSSPVHWMTVGFLSLPSIYPNTDSSLAHWMTVGFLSRPHLPEYGFQSGTLDDRGVLVLPFVSPNTDPTWHTGRPWGSFTTASPSIRIWYPIPDDREGLVTPPLHHHRPGTPEPRGNIQY